MSLGAVYVATNNNQKTLKQTAIEVNRSVRLLKRYSSIPITLICNKSFLRFKMIKLFDKVITHSSDFDGYMGAKIYALPLSPYDNTLILDNDTLPICNISQGFNFIKHRDIALSVAPRQELRNKPGITNYQNGVMFVNKNKRTLSMFEKWSQQVLKNGKDHPTRFIFSDLLEQSDLSIYALSYYWNFRIDLLLDYNISASEYSRVLPNIRVFHTHLKRKVALNIFKKHPQYNNIQTNMGSN